MKKILGIVLLIFALFFGYKGINEINNSTASIELIGLQFGATDEEKERKGYLLTGFSVLLLIGGLSLVDNSVSISKG